MSKQRLGILFCLILSFALQCISQSHEAIDTSFLNNEGLALLEEKKTLSDYKLRADLLRRAILIFDKTENWDMVVESKADLALQYYYLQEYDQFNATVKNLRTFLTKKKINEKSHFAALEIVVWYLEMKEDYSEAEKVYKEIFEYSTKVEDENQMFRTANNLGYFYLNYVSDFERSLDYYLKTLRILTNSKSSSGAQMALIYANLGMCYKKKEENRKSSDHFRKSLQYLEAEEEKGINIQNKWWSLQNLSDLYLANHQLDSCLYFGNQALEILQQPNTSYPDSYQTYHTLGEYYFHKRDTNKALKFFEKGLVEARKKEDVFRPIDALVNLSVFLSKQNNNQAALDSLDKGVEMLCPNFIANLENREPPASAFVHKKSALKLIAKRGEIFYKLYEIDNKNSNLTAALDNFILASEIIKLLRQDYVVDLSKYFLAEKTQSIYESGIDIAFELYGLNKNPIYIYKAFQLAEQNKSIALEESMKHNVAKGSGAIPDSLLGEEKELKHSIIELEKKIYQQRKTNSKDVAQLKIFEDELFKFKKRYNDFIVQLELNYPKYFQIKYKTVSPGVVDVQEALSDAKVMLLEYFVGDNHLYLFCIEKKSVQFYKIEKTKTLWDGVEEMRGLISQPPNSENYSANLKRFNVLSFEIYNALVKNALDNSGANRLIVIADDLLNYLPFETFLLEDKNADSYSLLEQNYLLENYDICYNLSASMFLKNNAKFYEKRVDFAGFAPEFKNQVAASSRDCFGGELYNLHCNQEEVNHINAMFSGHSFLGNNASRDSFIKVRNNNNIIHLATHACVDEENPDYSQIHFVDQPLSNNDLANLQIEANLAVLSACNTNVGPLMKGDGVVSISKGFFLAGCPSVLTSLWAVDDCSTSQIMIDFYRALKNGNHKSSSIRKSKLAYLQSVDDAHAHPYFWAPFLITGNDLPILNEQHGFSWFLVFGIVTLFALVYLIGRLRKDG